MIPDAKAMLLEDNLEIGSDQLQPLIGHSILDKLQNRSVARKKMESVHTLASSSPNKLYVKKKKKTF